MEIIGVILLVVAGICLWVWRRRQATLIAVGATATYTADLLNDIYLPAGIFGSWRRGSGATVRGER